METEVQGVNAADRLAMLLVAHRDPVTLAWNKKPILDIPNETIPTDVPAWWILKKKNAMFYNGFGRGDFGRFLMLSNLLTVKDTTEAREVYGHFGDVLAYIKSIKAPKYPKPINQELAKNGETIFINNCSKCHGTYGEKESYPNLLIPSNIIKTDSLLFKANYQNPQFIEWFNKSWYAQGDYAAKLVPANGYVAPPLDGIWATAPYLHNGSVPTIEAVLNSKIRPTIWSRNFTSPKYNYEILGWEFEEQTKPNGKKYYNTKLPGYGNHGHYFGDKLTDAERKALIEYLKTL
jgi:mono/diheme cytochrome c family protein